MTEIELLPCPCCKADAVHRAEEGVWHLVRCTNRKCDMQSGIFPTQPMAIRAWNTRVPPSTVGVGALADEALKRQAVLGDPHNHVDALAADLVFAGESEVQAAADEVVSRIVEWDDRTSPEDFPEALLITPSELHRELVQFATDIGALASPPPASAGVRELREGLEKIISVPSGYHAAAKMEAIARRTLASGEKK